MQQGPSTVRVVVADDDEMARAGLIAVLDRSPGVAVVGEAADGGQALHVSMATHPDVVLMDVRMPVVDGIGATRMLIDAHVAAGVRPPRVVVTTRDDGDQFTYEALRAGAYGFLVKDSPPEALAAGVRLAAGDGALLEPERLLRLVATYARAEPDGSDATDRLACLDPGQLRLVEAIAAGRSDAAVAERYGVEPAAVAALVAAVCDRLGARDRSRLLLLAADAGLVRPPAPAR